MTRIILSENLKDCETTSYVRSTEDYLNAVSADGKPCLVASRDHNLVLVCAGSEEYLTDEDAIYDDGLIIDNDNYCYSISYAKENLTKCDRCGRWELSDKGEFTEDDKFYCDDCFYEATYCCDDCGRDYSREYFTEHGINGEDQNGFDVHYCEHCAEDYRACENCNCVIHLNFVCEIDGEPYCPSCARDIRKEDDRILHSYHYDGNETDYDMSYLTDKNRTDNPLLGVEAEMDEGGTDEDVIEEIKSALGSEHCVACEDGSLRNGFELISCPATLSHHKKTLDWAAAFDKALHYDYRAHDAETCGLHVHVDRDFFRNGVLTTDEVEGAMFVVLKNNVDWLKRFSRRFNYHYCEINGDDDGQVVKDYAKYHEKWTHKAMKEKRDRYQAINFSRSDTIEFRIFRGTLNIKTFYATLQLVDLFARLVKKCATVGGAMNINLDIFVEEAENRNYKEFVEYCKQIGIVDNTETGF